MQEGESMQFLCKCSYLEIYNETISDLLSMSEAGLHVREDVKQGVYVEGLMQAEVTNGAPAPAVGCAMCEHAILQQLNAFLIAVSSSSTQSCMCPHHARNPAAQCLTDEVHLHASSSSRSCIYVIPALSAVACLQWRRPCSCWRKAPPEGAWHRLP